MSRRSYSGLMAEPAWGLYAHQGTTNTANAKDKLVASCRAPDIHAAHALFKKFGLRGDRVRRLP